MCNMAAYVGARPAAPILLEMLKRQEGFEGGYYSGIATLHEGRIYYCKLTGDTDRLIRLTEAARLPGNIGIIHSRSKSGGGDEWAHPFVAKKGDEVVTAYVANGARGFFRANGEVDNECAARLIDMGYEMARVRMEKSGYPTLPDGSYVHMSDIMCQQIQYFLDKGLDAPSAMDAAFHEIPAELAGLLLTLSEPTSVAWSRINMPLWVGFSSHGGYLATSALAFADDVGEANLIPGSAAGRLYSDRYEVIPYKTDPCRIARIDHKTAAAAYKIIYELLLEGGKSYPQCYQAIRDCFPEADIVDSEPLTYGILQSIAKSGRLKTETVRVPGVVDGIDAPKTLFTIV